MRVYRIGTVDGRPEVHGLADAPAVGQRGPLLGRLGREERHLPEVAAGHPGKIDVLTDEQLHYLNSWEEGT